MYIHLGPHKTGTTSFQYFCYHNKQILIKELDLWYTSFCLSKTVYHHGYFVDVLEECNSALSINRFVDRFFYEINKQDCSKIIISSERFLELIVFKFKTFEYFINILKSSLNIVLVYIDRKPQSIVESGIKHFLNIVNEKNVRYYSNYFGFKLNNINSYFELNDVEDCMLNWITDAYKRLKSFDCNYIMVKYSNNIIQNIMHSININIDINLIKDLLKNQIRLNSYSTFSRTDLVNYSKFCSFNYNSSKKIEFVSLKEFIS